MFGRRGISLAVCLQALLLDVGPQPAIAAEARCARPWDNSDVVEVTIVTQFNNPSFQSEWVYRSLRARIKIAGSWQFTEDSWQYPEDERVEDRALRSVFCVSATHGRTQFDTFHFSYGPRERTLASRPVDWSNPLVVRSELEPGSTHNVYTMQEILLTKLPDPDWPILKSATLSLDADGDQLLDVEIYNPTKTDAPGGVLSVLSHSHIALCQASASGPEIFEVPVSLSWSDRRCGARIAPAGQAGTAESSASCDFPAAAPARSGGRALLRSANATYNYERCPGYSASIVLGETGAYQGEEMTTLRYVFANRSPLLTDVLRGDLSGLPPEARAAAKGNSSLVKIDGSVYPNDAVIVFGEGLP